MLLLFPLAAFCTGALIPIQAAANGTLSTVLRSVTYASVVLFTIGLLFVLLIALICRVEPPSVSQFASVPGYGFTGGIIVATYVFTITFLAPRMGVGNAITWVVTGQIVAAVLIDHFGLIGVTAHPVSWSRVTGVLFMVGGTFLARS